MAYIFLLGSAALEEIIRIQTPISWDLDNRNIQESVRCGTSFVNSVNKYLSLHSLNCSLSIFANHKSDDVSHLLKTLQCLIAALRIKKQILIMALQRSLISSLQPHVSLLILQMEVGPTFLGKHSLGTPPPSDPA